MFQVGDIIYDTAYDHLDDESHYKVIKIGWFNYRLLHLYSQKIIAVYKADVKRDFELLPMESNDILKDLCLK